MNPHDPCGSADFKSAVSADFTIRASCVQSMVEEYPVWLPNPGRQRTASSQIAAIPAMLFSSGSGIPWRA